MTLPIGLVMWSPAPHESLKQPMKRRRLSLLRYHKTIYAERCTCTKVLCSFHITLGARMVYDSTYMPEHGSSKVEPKNRLQYLNQLCLRMWLLLDTLFCTFFFPIAELLGPWDCGSQESRNWWMFSIHSIDLVITSTLSISISTYEIHKIAYTIYSNMQHNS